MTPAHQPVNNDEDDRDTTPMTSVRGHICLAQHEIDKSEDVAS